MPATATQPARFAQWLYRGEMTPTDPARIRIGTTWADGRRVVADYALTIEGDAFRLDAADGSGRSYMVRLGARHGRCTCPDYERRGGPCKHQLALDAAGLR
jgi:hypothetical protein